MSFLCLALAAQTSFLSFRQATSQAIYGIISSPSYTDLLSGLAASSYYTPNLPVPTGDYPQLSSLQEDDFLLAFRKSIERGESPFSFGFASSLAEFGGVSAAFAKNISAQLIAQYAPDSAKASRAYDSFLDHFATIEASSPREAFSASPDVSIVFGAFPANIMNQSLYGTHGIGAAWLRTGMSVGFRAGYDQLKTIYDRVELGTESASLCDIVAQAGSQRICTTGLLELGFKTYLENSCGLNFNNVFVVDSWAYIDDTCMTIIGDVVQMKLMDNVTVFNETDIGSNFTVNYHALIRNDVGAEKIGNHELLSFLSFAHNQNLVSQRYSTVYRTYFQYYYYGSLAQNHNLRLFTFPEVFAGGALYDVLMQQKLFLIASADFRLLKINGEPFELAVVREAAAYLNGIYGLNIETNIEYFTGTKEQALNRLLTCTAETCDGKYYHGAIGFFERAYVTNVDYSDPLLMGAYVFYGSNLTDDELKNIRTTPPAGKVFCYVADRAKYTSDKEYQFVQAYSAAVADKAEAQSYDALFSGNCSYTYGLVEQALQMAAANATFVYEKGQSAVTSFSLVGKADSLGSSSYTQEEAQIVYTKNNNLVYNGLTVIMSLSVLFIVVPTVVLVALN